MSTSEAIRARSFGSVSKRYADYRPGPPLEVLDFLLPDGAESVADVGAGTGNLTRLLVQRVANVNAVEPDARMRSVLAERVPDASPIEGVAETLPLPDGSQDAVLSSSAWHWVDPERAVPEAARVLRKGGLLGAVWASLDREVEWVLELWRSLRPPSMQEPSSGRRRGLRLVEGASFEQAEGPHILRYSQGFTAEQLVGLAGTYSAVITQPPAEREALLQSLQERLAEDPRLADGAELEIPMLAVCWRATRS